MLRYHKNRSGFKDNQSYIVGQRKQLESKSNVENEDSNRGKIEES